MSYKELIACYIKDEFIGTSAKYNPEPYIDKIPMIEKTAYDLEKDNAMYWRQRFEGLEIHIKVIESRLKEKDDMDRLKIHSLTASNR